MFAAERFGDVAVPANGQVRLHGFLQLLGRNIAPLNGLTIRANERWRVVVPMQIGKRLMAVGALLAFVPAIDDGTDQASFRSFFDLHQAFLAARILFGPTRACAQLQVFMPESSA